MKWVIRIAGGLVLVLAAGAVLLLIMGHRANAGRAHVSTEISASPAQIWPYLNEGDKLKVRGWDAQSQGVGTTRIWVLKDENNGGQLIEVQAKCTEYAPPARLALLLSSSNVFDGEQSYQLVDLGNGRTLLKVDARYHFTQWFPALMEPLITPQVEKKMVGDVARLKALVERNGTGVAAR
jgi:hypothetical protein